jgi:hypothetical protein
MPHFDSVVEVGFQQWGEILVNDGFQTWITADCVRDTEEAATSICRPRNPRT